MNLSDVKRTKFVSHESAFGDNEQLSITLLRATSRNGTALSYKLAEPEIWGGHVGAHASRDLETVIKRAENIIK